MVRCLALTGFLLFLLVGCSSLQEQKSFVIPFEHFGNPAVGGKHPYELVPQDLIDVLYHFDTSQTGKYRIAPHDKLKIQFLTASRYNDLYQVRPDGFIALPLVGDLEVQGLTLEEVHGLLIDIYKDIINRPEFFVTFAEYQVQLKEVKDSLRHPSYGYGRLITVRDDYMISLPFIGEISIMGKSIAEVSKEANSRYGQILSGMSVDLLLQKSKPLEIFVFGEVKKPGSHRISSPVSLIAALAMAGGANSEARLDTVLVMRKEGDEMVATLCDFKALLSGTGVATLLHPEDMVYVPRSRLSNAARTVNYIADILLFRGMDIGFSYRLDD